MISQRHLHQESRRALPPCIARRNQQALKHLGLAHCSARRQQQRGPEEFDDLLQESRVGLIRGLERFDQQRGLRPSSYLLSRATAKSSTTAAIDHAPFGFPGDCVISTQPE